MSGAFLAVVVGALWPAAAVGQQAAAASDAPAGAIFLLDASGSMWGTLPDAPVAKHELARDAIARALPAFGATTPIGIASFGPGCRSADVIAAPAPTDAASFVDRLRRFNPRGKGPLTLGIETAASQLPGEHPSDVIVLHDGLDNCGENTCAMAERLAKAKPKLRVHTVLLGGTAGEQEAIACVARATSGSAHAVPGASDLDKALSSIAALIRRGDGSPVAAGNGGPAASAAPAPTSASPEEGPPRLVVAPLLARGGAKITVPVRWLVSDATDGPGRGSLIADISAPVLTLEQPPARVAIEARVGIAQASGDFAVAARGTTEATLEFGAGIARLDTRARKLASEADEPVLRLHRVSADTGGMRSAPLWIARGKAIEAVLPAGRYKAFASYGLAHAQADLEIEAGGDVTVPMPLAAGRLELAVAGLPADSDVVYAIAVDDLAAPGGRREVARTMHRTPAFVLPTGAYYVTAETQTASVRRLIAVREGDVTRETLTFETGTLTVTPQGAGMGRTQPAAEPVSLWLRPQAGGQSLRLQQDRATPLAPGTYTLQARAADGTPLQRRTVQIAAGRAEQVNLDVARAALTVNLAVREGSPLLTRCVVRSASGETVARTVAAMPRLLLPAGAYRVRCDTPAGARESAVELTAGATVTLAPFGDQPARPVP